MLIVSYGQREGYGSSLMEKLIITAAITGSRTPGDVATPTEAREIIGVRKPS